MQNNKLTSIIIIIAVLATGLFFLLKKSDFSSTNSSVTPSPNLAATVVPFTKLVDGMQTNISIRTNYVITSTAELNELWKTIGAKGTPPSVDFTTNSVLAVFAGEESNGPISVAKIEDTDKRLISITLVQREGTCAKSKTAGFAYELVAVSTTSLPLIHEDSIATSTCP